NEQTKSALGRKLLLSYDQEKLSSSRIIRLCSVGYPITQRVLRTCVKTFCKLHNIPVANEDVKSGRDWLRGFLKLHNHISRRKAQNLNPARAQKLNKTVVTEYFNKLKKIMQDNDIMNQPERILNIDEEVPQVLTKRGTKLVHLVAPEHSKNVTVASCAN
ncbi:hypothetical protein HHI36_006057, partial [Cryptolaemus montrouzieri]